VSRIVFPRAIPALLIYSFSQSRLRSTRLWMETNNDGRVSELSTSNMVSRVPSIAQMITHVNTNLLGDVCNVLRVRNIALVPLDILYPIPKCSNQLRSSSCLELTHSQGT
jgi:hypothetical protein